MEPERKIEKWLRSYAKKRRADAGDSFKLHPATRRLLQNEAARRAPKSAAGEGSFFLKLFSGLRPGIVYAACFAVLVFMGALLLLPALSRAKSKSQMASSMSNLKQLGVAAHTFAGENNERLPMSLAEMQNLAGSNTLIDPASGKPFVYVAGGRSVDSLRPDSVLAYSPEATRSRAVLFADGHVEAVNGARFSELTNRGLLQLALADNVVRRKVAETPTPASAPVVAESSSLASRPSEQMKLASSRDESKADDSQAKSLTVAATENRKAESASVYEKKMDEPLVTAKGGVAATSAGVSGQNAASKGGVAEPVQRPETGGTLLAAAAPSKTGPNFDRLAVEKDSALDKAAIQTRTPSGAPVASQQLFVQTGSASNLQQIFKNAIASAKAAPVLANFQVQQNGTAISVVDADGSVYNGYLLATDATVQNEPAAVQKIYSPRATPPPQLKEKAPQTNKAAEQSAQNYFFRVAGTNRSLKQNVVFTGNLVAISNAAQVPQQTVGGGFTGGGGGGGQFQQAYTNQSQQWLFSNSRIAGTALINNTNAIEINAVPVPQ
jgi:prepilin-type processing-associated H-X9-DG protein